MIDVIIASETVSAESVDIVRNVDGVWSIAIGLNDTLNNVFEKYQDYRNITIEVADEVFSGFSFRTAAKRYDGGSMNPYTIATFANVLFDSAEE